MSVDNRNGKWVPGREEELLGYFDTSLISIGMLGLPGGREKQIYQMKEFPLADPWRVLAARGIEDMAINNQLYRKNLIEFGTGTGPQILTAVYAEPTINKVTGIDINDWKLAAALGNFQNDELLNHMLQAGQVELHNKHAMRFLEEWNDAGDNVAAIMCLPQASRGSHKEASVSDVIKNDQYVAPYIDRWGPTALQLNAGVLNNLAQKTEADARALVILSGRVSERVRENLITENGWQIDKIAAEAKVSQDLDTPLDWMMSLHKSEQGRLYDQYGDPLTFDQGIDRHNNNIQIMHDVYAYNIVKR